MWVEAIEVFERMMAMQRLWELSVVGVLGIIVMVLGIWWRLDISKSS